MKLLRVFLGAIYFPFVIGIAVPAYAATYWSLFNIEGESAVSAQYVTYASLADMLGDSNRLGVFNPGTFGHNIACTPAAAVGTALPGGNTAMPPGFAP